MDLKEGSETSANINQTLGIHPKIETVKYVIIIISIYSSCLPITDQDTCLKNMGLYYSITNLILVTLALTLKHHYNQQFKEILGCVQPSGGRYCGPVEAAIT
jgi:hypothetical protein